MQYHALEKFINLHDGYRRAFQIDAHHLLLLQESGRRYLIESRCPHRGMSLFDARLQGESLTCRHHHYRFDIRDGSLLASTEEPCRALRRYELVERDTEVGVML